MPALVQNYRGYDIYFDQENETFISHIENDHRTKRSFSGAKKSIDEYLKGNETFDPFKIHRDTDFEHIITVTGIRKDGRLSTEEADGTKGQLSDWDQARWCMINPENKQYYDHVIELRKQIDEIEEQISSVRAKIIVQTCRDYAKKFNT